MRTSEIDAAVYLHRLDTSHRWGIAIIDDLAIEFCDRCGKRKDHLRKPDTDYEYLPCSGVVGGF